MQMLSLTTPSLLFSAISLILLAFTNRFLSYASVVRNLQEQAERHPEQNHIPQIQNLYKRLKLVRIMQNLGTASFLMCVVSMLAIFMSLDDMATYTFFLALVLLAVSLVVCLWEIQISIKALQINLDRLFLSEKRRKQRNMDNKTVETLAKRRRRPAKNGTKQEIEQLLNKDKENIVQKSRKGLQD